MRTPHNDPLGSDISAGRAPREAPERRCILSGDHGARDDLVRLAISPPLDDGRCEVLPDALAKAPGRGAWLGVDRAALEAAIANGKFKGALARAFKGEALTIPTDLGAKIEAALTRALTDRLGLEQRTGKLLTGSDRIADKARAGQVAWLAHAGDAGVWRAFASGIPNSVGADPHRAWWCRYRSLPSKSNSSASTGNTGLSPRSPDPICTPPLSSADGHRYPRTSLECGQS